jgi:hypothetical protein
VLTDDDVSDDTLTAPRALGNWANDGLRLLLKPMQRKVQGNGPVGSAAGTNDHAAHGGTGANLSSVRTQTDDWSRGCCSVARRSRDNRFAHTSVLSLERP